MTCKDEATITEVIRALKAKYNDVQKHKRYEAILSGHLRNMSEVGVCSITMPTFITEVLKDVELGSAAESSPPLDEAHRKRLYSKVAQLLYLGKRHRIHICLLRLHF